MSSAVAEVIGCQFDERRRIRRIEHGVDSRYGGDPTMWLQADWLWRSSGDVIAD